MTASAFSNFSKALLPPGSAAALRASNGAVYAPLSTVAGGSGGVAVAAPPAAGGVQLQVVDYSRQPLSGEGLLLACCGAAPQPAAAARCALLRQACCYAVPAACLLT